MFAWIAENALTVTVIAVILAAAGLAVFSLVRDKKKKKGGCTGNCATCGMGCSCGGSKKDN
ncbi:MAG: FeoB-associated Cys-rich membrane protein [Clostridia bacterium]|nr:FeoB-associated Cys-rich membrane protein [Clostridia bacterium]